MVRACLISDSVGDSNSRATKLALNAGFCLGESSRTVFTFDEFLSCGLAVHSCVFR
jgi:hypothetical protein